MKFRTEIPTPQYPFHLDYHHRLLFIGSCFSDHIGDFFVQRQFQAVVNPFGTLFNPISIATALQTSLHPESFTDKHLIHFQEYWHSFLHHSRFSNRDKELLINNIKNQLSYTKKFLLQTDFLFITFGTAYCYRYKKEDLIVANCHKLPATEFNKELIDIQQIKEINISLAKEIRAINPEIKIIFTVSPVRHLGDGFHENQISKSILHLAINELVDNEKNFYFPAYEIFQDDLRDYRYYSEDLCHPAAAGIRYIEEKIAAAFFTPETKAQADAAEKALKASQHHANIL